MSPEPTRSFWTQQIAPPGSLRNRAWHWLRQHSRSLLRWQGPETLDLQDLAGGEKGLRWLIISGCPGASRRYRVDHLQSYFKSAGAKVAVLQAQDARLTTERQGLLRSVDGLIFQRVTANSATLKLRDQARKQGLKTIYESDDLVFEKSPASPDGESKSGQGVYLNHRDLKKHRDMLVGCDWGLTSTELLQERMFAQGLSRVFVFRNGASEQLRDLSRLAREHSKRSPEIFRLGYASGTPTHDHDFRSVSDGIADALARHANLRLTIIGPLKLFGAITEQRHKIDREPWIDWTELPMRLARWDLNLAPFTLNTPFNQGKSAVKFLEAALVAVPTLASPLPSYRRVYEEGRGLTLASSSEEWSNALSEAFENRDATKKRGEQALETAEALFSPEQRRIDAIELLSQLHRED